MKVKCGVLCNTGAFVHRFRIIPDILFFTGRYNKYSRNLPQTPWIIDGERKLDSSVEELISEHLMAEFKADSKYPEAHLPYIFFIITRVFSFSNYSLNTKV